MYLHFRSGDQQKISNTKKNITTAGSLSYSTKQTKHDLLRAFPFFSIRYRILYVLTPFTIRAHRASELLQTQLLHARRSRCRRKKRTSFSHATGISESWLEDEITRDIDKREKMARNATTYIWLSTKKRKIQNLIQSGI